MPQFRVEVDRLKCNGFGACVELCPHAFYLGEDGRSKIRGAEEVVEGDMNVKDFIVVDDLGCYKIAEEACPFQAINVQKLSEAI
ncbi:MAG: ferredoxin [Candidatus Bathyarchaeota archaeon]|nr:MAG: ferredoxin [Candidatus Bathyarchaeota archaeon]